MRSKITLDTEGYRQRQNDRLIAIAKKAKEQVKKNNKIFRLEPDEKSIELVRREYNASGGKELFLSFEDTSQDILLGFLRLRHPSKNNHLITAVGDTPISIIREVHVYGSVVGIGDTASSKKWQHKGFGTKLIDEAEKIAKEEAGNELILVTSGIGVREYYANRGFEKLLPYMAKKL